MTSKCRALRLRKANFPSPLQSFALPQASIMHPAHLPLAGASAVAFLNAQYAELAGPPLELAAERSTDRASNGTEVGRSAPDRRPGEA